MNTDDLHVPVLFLFIICPVLIFRKHIYISLSDLLVNCKRLSCEEMYLITFEHVDVQGFTRAEQYK